MLPGQKSLYRQAVWPPTLGAGAIAAEVPARPRTHHRASNSSYSTWDVRRPARCATVARECPSICHELADARLTSQSWPQGSPIPGTLALVESHYRRRVRSAKNRARKLAAVARQSGACRAGSCCMGVSVWKRAASCAISGSLAMCLAFG